MTQLRHYQTGLEPAAKRVEQQTLQLVPRLPPSRAGFTFEGRVAFAMDEIWKPVFGFEGLYEVSDRGRVRAMYEGNHGQYKAGRIVKSSIHQNGYVFVSLYRPGSRGKAKARSVHSLVLEAFKEPRPRGKVTRHLDRVRNHNTPDNLAWGTSADNAADAKSHGTFVLGEKNGFSKLTTEDVIEIRRLRDSGIACQAIADKYGVHWSNVWLIGKRRTWKHV